MRRREITKRKIRKSVDRLMSANANAKAWHEMTHITKKVVGEIVGGCTTAIRTHMNAWQDELDAHHALYGITTGHNARVHNYRRANPPDEPKNIQTTNHKALAYLNRHTVGLMDFLKCSRYSFREGELIGVSISKNIHRTNIELKIQTRELGCLPSVIKTIKQSRKTPANEQRFFNTDLLEINLTYETTKR